MSDAVDKPFYDVLISGERLIRRGATLYFKFTCEECGSRQTFDKPNKLYEEGECERCGHVTSLVENGCGYMLVI